MSEQTPTFEDAARFHGHTCPGLAFGFRVARVAIRELGLSRAEDEELVAVVENDSCAVDAIQVLTGCTFGKGNLIFRDHGKQVYTFFKRATGE
ncbi:MAG: formylmethanofuran dehydrogenase, partial [Desulfobulbaceae bacterium]|nr:formylmethanofuran dehydrogenase [Desulfobulbaceae bacterium]